MPDSPRKKLQPPQIKHKNTVKFRTALRGGNCEAYGKEGGLDAAFESRFGHESDEKKDLLKRKALQKYQFSQSRLEAVTRHAIGHFREKIYKNKNKAVLVCDGRHGAIRHKQMFQALRLEGLHDFDTLVVNPVGALIIVVFATASLFVVLGYCFKVIRSTTRLSSSF